MAPASTPAVVSFSSFWTLCMSGSISNHLELHLEWKFLHCDVNGALAYRWRLRCVAQPLKLGEPCIEHGIKTVSVRNLKAIGARVGGAAQTRPVTELSSWNRFINSNVGWSSHFYVSHFGMWHSRLNTKWTSRKSSGYPRISTQIKRIIGCHGGQTRRVIQRVSAR